MKKIGIFLDEITDNNIDDNQKFAKLGYNTGNMAFWHSLKTQLDLDVIPRWYINNIDQIDLSEYKAFITTDLIWIRQMQDFSYLNKTLDAIGDFPLIPISIGLQCDSCDPDFKLHPETVKVIKRIEERCIMGVRGKYTASILEKYGVSNYQVIGCPSMYMPVDGFKNVSNSKSDIKKVSMNFETFYNKLDDKRIEFLRYGAENEFDFVEQAEAELEENMIDDKETCQKIKKWIDSNGNLFFDLDEWRNYIRNHDFSIGSRFHGNVLALWEGVPALFVTCDSRTQELCDFYNLPRIDISKFDGKKDIFEYYGMADYSLFHEKYRANKYKWEDFLRMNSINNNETVLYHAYHAGTLSQVLIHRLTYNKDKDAFLLVGNVQLMGAIHNKLNEFVDNNIFKKILVCSECIGYRLNDEVECENTIVEHFDKVFFDANINLDSFCEIYTGVDTLHSFGVYLSLKKKNYYFFEMHPNFFMNAQKRVNELPGEMRVYANVMTKHGASNGTGEFVTRIVHHNSEYNIEENPKVIEFDFNSKVLEIQEDDKIKLLNIYDYSFDLDTDKPVDLIATSSQWLLRNLPDVKRQACTMYQIIADYYMPENANLVIKPHPLSRVTSEEFNRFFDVPVFKEYFPTNFLSMISNLKVKSIYTSTSDISDQIKYTDKSVLLGDVYVKNYLLTYKLHYCISLFFYLLNNQSDYQLYHYGISNDYINNLLLYSFNKNMNSTWLNCHNIQDFSFCIVDDINWNPGDYKNALSNSMLNGYGSSVFVFVNSKKDYFFLDMLEDEHLKNLVIIDLEKERNKKNVNSSMNTETIYIYCADKKIRQFIEAYNYFKHNKYSGFDISSFDNSTSDIYNRVIFDAMKLR